jgi:tetratricopeptide (TPR) repeat protein
MRPNLIIDTDEIDFINHVENTYQLTPSLLIQDRRPICVKEGDKAFNIGDYTSALSWYNKGLEYCEGKDKAIFYYRKSVAYINLGQYNESIQMINQTIESDGDKYEGSVLELINEMKRRGVEFM